MTSVPALAGRGADGTWTAPVGRLRACAVVGLSVAAALALWTAVPALRLDDWRWIALGLDTVPLACLLPLSASALRAGGSLRPAHLLALTAALAAYALAVVATVSGAPAAAYVTSALVTLLAIATGVTACLAATVAGPRPLPRWLAPGVLAVALLAGVGHGVVSGWDVDAYRVAVAVLAAGTPAALVAALSLPLWLGARRGRAAGIGLRHTSALPVARTADNLVLDGLATLADGKRVTTIDPVDESHLRNLRWFAGALEHASDNATGRALARLSARGNVTGFREHPGLGVSGHVDRHPVRIGQPQWLGVAHEGDSDGAEETVAVEVDNRVLGTISVVDAVREDAPAAVAALRAAGIDSVLVTDVSPARSSAVAEAVGVRRVVSATSEGSVVLTGSADPSVSDAALVLGPASPQLTLDSADVASAERALRLCRGVSRGIASGSRLALGWHGLAVGVAAAGLLAPWAAAVLGLAGLAVTAVAASHT